MKGFDWYPRYPKSFMTSRSVRGMSWAQRGIYSWLLDEQWDGGPLQGDHEAIANMIGADPSDVRIVLAACFTETRKGWLNEALASLLQAQKEKHAKYSAAGKKGGRPRKARAPQTPAAQRDTGKSQALSSLSNGIKRLESQVKAVEEEEERDNKGASVPAELFALARPGETMYAVEKAYHLAVASGADPANLLKARKSACGGERRYWKSLSKWLHEVSMGGLPEQPETREERQERLRRERVAADRAERRRAST